jgi:hypothetical protein
MRLVPERLRRDKIARLSPFGRLLLLSWAALALARLSLRLFGFHPVHRFIDRFSKPLPWLEAKGLSAERVAWGVEMAARCLPGVSACLARALAARALLGAYGCSSTLKLGVRRAQGELLAHAWLIGPNGETLMGQQPGLSDYAAFPLKSPNRV